MTSVKNGEPLIVPFDLAHADGVPAVLEAVCREYGFTWDDSPYFDDVRDVCRAYIERGGMFWVALDGPRVVGMIGVTPNSDLECELHRLYVLSEYRGRRLGQRLTDEVLHWARRRGYGRIVLWSDVKLVHAHALYRANGFVQCGERMSDDPDRSREYGFCRELA